MKKPDRENSHRCSDRFPSSFVDSITTFFILCGVTAIAFAFQSLGFSDANLIMVFIFGVVLTSVRTGRLFGVAASILSVFLFNFFFTEPRYTFAVNDTQYIFTFVVMLAVALIISALTVREKNQAKQAAEREQRANVLFRVSRALLASGSPDAICRKALEQINDTIPGVPVIILEGSAQTPSSVLYPGEGEEPVTEEPAAFQIPIRGSEGHYGYLSIHSIEKNCILSKEEESLLQTFAAQISLALDRERILTKHEEAKVRAENDKLRLTILRSISHDFRTPLAGITGASSTLLSDNDSLEDDTRNDLLKSIHDEATWLSHMVENILSLTRVQSAGGVIRKVPEVLDDVLLSAVQRIRGWLGEHELEVQPPSEVVLVPMEGTLIEQVLINLLTNAIQHTPEGTNIVVSAGVLKEEEKALVEFSVEDNGPGIPDVSIPTIFDLFKQSQVSRSKNARGAGLGLGICRAVVEAHGGRITASNKPEGGARFSFTLPMEDEQHD
ncbi:MAG: DUF4118 domain-containing protein [Spirochaetales bacterium]|nr:DUF4118 domain-containing protein [Spirochaetales bacterium]